jgi:ABC transporter substrate binding protein
MVGGPRFAHLGHHGFDVLVAGGVDEAEGCRSHGRLFDRIPIVAFAYAFHVVSPFVGCRQVDMIMVHDLMRSPMTSGNQFTSPAIASFRREMGNLGYVEGGNLTIEFRTAPGEPQRIVSQAAELVGMPVDVIVTDGTPAALAAKQATSNIPIVMAVIGVDPVQSGLVTSFARPGGNIAGFPILAPELGTKRLEILKEAVPGLKRVGVLWNSTNPTNSTPQLAALAEQPARLE